MPAESNSFGSCTEKPEHYAYITEFRTQQCALFAQHKCTQHRPYTCFNWHFLSQRRRCPAITQCGTFNYSPDVYCTKYDETNGICPDGDECPFLHRTAGDTERRYHLRYYKTGTCIFETDLNGCCIKNGPHCAFAHGMSDTRLPFFDANEIHSLESLEKSQLSDLPNMELVTSCSLSPLIDVQTIQVEDPQWNDSNYILANYKTELCKRPSRLCRQGYACPCFHNLRDRRRSPKQFKYRSIACPNVKHGDEWSDPSQCDSKDNCVYCHTRTEQQFHPEIYKSTKCNDMILSGTCPRGTFCAFAHVEDEMTSKWDVLTSSNNSMAAFVTGIFPSSNQFTSSEPHIDILDMDQLSKTSKLPDPIGNERSSNNIPQGMATADLFCQIQSESIISNISSDNGFRHTYHKAPGSEREESNMKLRQQLQRIERSHSLENNEQNMWQDSIPLLCNNGGKRRGIIKIGSQALFSPGIVNMSSMSPLAPSFYPAGDTVESVVGKALDDMSLEEFHFGDFDHDVDCDGDTISSSLSTGLSASAFPSSMPIGIPASTLPRQQLDSISSLSQCPFGSLPLPGHDPHYLAGDLLSPVVGHSIIDNLQTNHYNNQNIISTCISGALSVLSFTQMDNHDSRSNGPIDELQQLREELHMTKSKMAEWEGVYNQAKRACDAWRREAEECTKRAKAAEEEKLQMIKQRDEAALKHLRPDVTLGPFPPLFGIKEIEALPLKTLQQMRHQLFLDLNGLDQVIYRKF